MSDTATQTNTAEQTNQETIQDIQPAKIGKVEKLPTNIVNIPNTETTEGANATTDANKGVEDGLDGEKSGNGTTKSDSTPAPTEEQIKAFFKEKGIEYEGVDKLKEKLNPTIPATEEQKKEAALIKEKRLVDIWIKGGGTVEQYVAVKNVADSDLSELSINSLKKELKDAKFSEEEIEKIIKDRYFQISDDELEEQYEDESDKDFAKRKKEYGATKLANRSLHTKQHAQEILAGLNKAVESEDLQVQEEKLLSSKIDEHFQTMPRKLSLEIGDIKGKPITPIEYEVSESDLKSVQSDLKDPDKRNNILFNKDGDLNITKISELLVENRILKSQLKAVYHESATRTNAEWEKVFPARTAQELGIGGSNTNRNTGSKEVAGFGKTQRVRPSTT